LWLWERGDDAKARAATLSPEGRARVLAMFDAKFDDVRPQLLALTANEADAMRAASPEGHLASLRAPAFLLAGDHDPVVPPSETRWLERALPPGTRGGVVVTPAIKHVEIEGTPTAAQTAELVHWMGQILGAARR
jgi:pimeloyl-ACP methyl ester carboxylesterase